MRLQRTSARLADALGDGAGGRALLFEHLRPRVLLWVTARLPDDLGARLDAEALTEDILVEAREAFGSWHGEGLGPFFAWLFGRAEAHVLAFEEGRSDATTCLRATVLTPKPVQQLIRAIRSLPPGDREVLRLKRLEGCSLEHVATRLGRSEEEVSVLYCRAVGALGDAIERGCA